MVEKNYEEAPNEEKSDQTMLLLFILLLNLIQEKKCSDIFFLSHPFSQHTCACCDFMLSKATLTAGVCGEGCKGGWLGRDRRLRLALDQLKV